MDNLRVKCPICGEYIKVSPEIPRTNATKISCKKCGAEFVLGQARVRITRI